MPYLNPVYIEGCSHEYGAFEIKKSLYNDHSVKVPNLIYYALVVRK